MLTKASGSLFHLDYFASFVETTFGTDAVLQTWLLAIWTGDGLRYPQGIVGPALTAT
jgi:hypothetical protein